MFRRVVFGFLVFIIYRLLSWTWRIQLEEAPLMKKMLAVGSPLILAHWHGDELVLISFATRYRIATITSTSKDGELMDFVLRRLGGKTSRGSSTRGAVTALKGLLRLVRNNRHNCSFAVDGPKGPLHQVKPGVFELSRLAGAPIFAAGVTCDRAWRFERSWNKAYLPKPFAHIFVVWMGPYGPIERSEDPRSPSLQHHLAEALRNAEEESRKKIAAPSVGC